MALPSRCRISRTIITARSRSSSGYLRCAGMTPNPSRDQSLQDHRGGPVHRPLRTRVCANSHKDITMLRYRELRFHQVIPIASAAAAQGLETRAIPRMRDSPRPPFQRRWSVVSAGPSNFTR
jgi:hypothetical protein